MLPKSCYVQSKCFQCSLLFHVLHIQDLDGNIAMPIALVDWKIKNNFFIFLWPLLADWFARKNVDDWIIFIQYLFTVPFQVCSITDKNIPFQSGSGIYERAKLTNPQYKHRVLYLKRMVVFHWFRPVSRTALGKLNCWFSVVGVWKVDYKIKMQVLILNNYDVIEESYNLC